MCSKYGTFKDLQVYFVSLVKTVLILGKTLHHKNE